MASAQTTKSSVTYTQRSSTTSKTTRGTLRSVSSAIADRLRGAPRSSTIGDSVDVRSVDDITDVSLLAHGGYNSIWLVKLRAPLEVKCNLLVIWGTAKQSLRREEICLVNVATLWNFAALWNFSNLITDDHRNCGNSSKSQLMFTSCSENNYWICLDCAGYYQQRPSITSTASPHRQVHSSPSLQRYSSPESNHQRSCIQKIRHL